MAQLEKETDAREGLNRLIEAARNREPSNGKACLTNGIADPSKLLRWTEAGLHTGAETDNFIVCNGLRMECDARLLLHRLSLQAYLNARGRRCAII